MVAVTVIGGAVVPEHSHASNYISELGADGATYGKLFSFAGFLPIGLLALGYLAADARFIVVGRAAKLGFALMLFIPAAYIAAAFAPCDLGCPAVGSGRQAIHNFFGVSEYLGGGIGLIIIGRAVRIVRWHEKLSIPLMLAGVIVLVAFQLMVRPELSEWRGLYQRIAETALFGSLLLMGWARKA